MSRISLLLASVIAVAMVAASACGQDTAVRETIVILEHAASKPPRCVVAASNPRLRVGEAFRFENRSGVDLELLTPDGDSSRVIVRIRTGERSPPFLIDSIRRPNRYRLSYYSRGCEVIDTTRSGRTVVRREFLGLTVSSPSDALLDALVWGSHRSLDTMEYEGRLRREIVSYLERSRAFRSQRAIPEASDMRMGYEAAVSYEQKLAAVSERPDASALASTYVTALRPCYEWEGFHDCPEAEAKFADDYLAKNPETPFADYLHLLSAQRWLCTAEAFEYEQKPQDAERSRREASRRLPSARASKSLLISTAASRLAQRNSCL